MDRRTAIQRIGAAGASLLAPAVVLVPTVESPTWKKRDGTVVRVVDMSDQHVLNCIRMLNRNHAAYLVLENEDHRSLIEYAEVCRLVSQQTLDSEGELLSELANGGPGARWPVYHELVREAYRRRLL